LLIWWDSLLVLDLGFDIVNGITCLHVECDGLARQCLDKDLHASTQSENKMQCGLFLNVVVRESSSIFQLFACKDQALLIWGNTFFVLNLCFDIVNGVTRFHIKGDGLSRQRLDKDLHASSQSQDKVKSGLFLDVVVRQSAPILELLACKDQALLIWGNTLFVLNLCFDIVNGVTCFHIKGDGLSRQRLHKDLHAST